MRRWRWGGLLVAAALVSAHGAPTPGYREPSAPVRAALDLPLPQRLLASPEGRWLALLEPARYVPLALLNRPPLRLAGLRFDAGALAPLPSSPLQGLRLRALNGGAERRVALPAGGVWHGFSWSPDGSRYLLQRFTPTGTELWVGSSSGTALNRLEGLRLNNVLTDGDLAWWSATEVVAAARPTDGVAPPRAALPAPVVLEHQGRPQPEAPHPDLLKSAHDEALFAHHARSQLVRVNLATGAVQRIGKPGLYFSVSTVGEGQGLLTERLLPPFSRSQPWDDFPQTVEVLDPSGRLLREVNRLPARPATGEYSGPRVVYAAPSRDAAIYWAEALDPARSGGYRDRVMRLDPPYQGEAREIQRLPHRFARLRFLGDGEHALLSETDRSRQLSRTYLLPLAGGQSRLLFEHGTRERLRHPGSPLMTLTPRGQRVVQVEGSGDHFWFVGQGAGPRGERPFLDRYSVRDMPVQRVFQAEGQVELPLQWLDGGKTLLTQVERAYDQRQLGVRPGLPGAAWQALTPAVDGPAALRGLRREVHTVRRDDGVELSFTLVLPADHQPGQKRAALLWAYPQEFNDAAAAAQAAAPSERTPWPLPGSPLWLALDGYAVVYDITFPIVGDLRTVNDTFLEQVQLSARAVVDKLEELGSVDLRRLAVGGQSYGAFMAVNLLAHTNLFKAGIARSGAYNRTLTPFGFQSERRNLWEAREVYLRLSPLLFANQIKEPLLLLHGEQDSQAGTPALQSERLYLALAGLGSPVRLALLPLEGHSLASREAAGHVQWEMSNWLRRYLGAPVSTAASGK